MKSILIPLALAFLMAGTAIGLSLPNSIQVRYTPDTPCTKMHRQLLVIPRVNEKGEFVDTPTVVDVCDKANVAYLESQ